MTSAWYRKQVLEPVLKPFLKEVRRKRDRVWFQQDGAPTHKALETTRWLNSNNISLFPHPSKSPDFSPIEPIFFDFKNIIRDHPDPITSTKQLKDLMRVAWDALTVEQINKYIKRLPSTFEQCIKFGGGMTHY